MNDEIRFVGVFRGFVQRCSQVGWRKRCTDSAKESTDGP
jgi:hypothetical protein